MKKRMIHVLFLFCCLASFSQNIFWNGQKKQPFELKYNNNLSLKDTTVGGITWHSKKRVPGEDCLPKGNYQRYKVKTEKQQEELVVCFVLKGYKFDKPVNIADDSLLIGKRIKPGERFVSEMLVDTNDVKHLTTYSMIPAMMQINRQPLTSGKKFSVLPFQQGVKTTTKGAFLLIYEDDENRSVYKYLKNYTKDQVLSLPFNARKEPFSKIERYFIVDPLILK